MKERFIALMKKRGFTSVRQFAIACGMESSNIYTNLVGKTTVGIGRLFTYANVLGVPVQDVLAIFYPEDMKANVKSIANRDKYLNQLNN